MTALSGKVRTYDDTDVRVFFNGADGHVHWVSSSDKTIEYIRSLDDGSLIYKRVGREWEIHIPVAQILRVDRKVS